MVTSVFYGVQYNAVASLSETDEEAALSTRYVQTTCSFVCLCNVVSRVKRKTRQCLRKG